MPAWVSPALYASIVMLAVALGWFLGAGGYGLQESHFTDNMNGAISLVKNAVVAVPLLCIVAWALTNKGWVRGFQNCREFLRCALAIVSRYHSFLTKAENMGETPKSISVLVGLSILGGCILAASAVLSLALVILALW